MKLDKPIILSLAILGSVAASALAQKAPEMQAAPAKKEIVSRFDALDTDKDGLISRTEAERMPGLPEVFDKADINKDGKLDAAEFEMAVSPRK